MQIRIREYLFTFPSRYQEGSQITAGEAQALERLRAENVRNVSARWVADQVAILSPGELLTKDQIDRLQVQIEQFAQTYRFPLKHEPAPKLDAIGREARAMAQDQVKAEARRLGETLSLDDFDLRVEEMMKRPSIQDEARRRVSAMSALANQSLEDL